MTFARLKEYLEEECSSDFIHLGDNFYLIRNCISGGQCVVQDLSFYDTPTLAHYFLELGVDVPAEYIDFYHVYTNLRSKIIK